MCEFAEIQRTLVPAVIVAFLVGGMVGMLIMKGSK